MLKVLVAVALSATLAAGVGAVADSCGREPAPSQGGGGEANKAAPPDPAPHAPTPETTNIRFRIYTTVEVVVTYNSGYGNKFFDSIKPPSDVWAEKAVKGATAYLSATPVPRGKSGRISVVIDYGTENLLICHNTNYDKLTAGTSCRERIH